MIVTVSCPSLGRIEIDAAEVVYEPNGDGTAIYEFGCASCRKGHMRHATIADTNQFRGSGAVRVASGQLVGRFDEAQLAALGAAESLRHVVTEQEVRNFVSEMEAIERAIEDELL